MGLVEFSKSGGKKSSKYPQNLRVCAHKIVKYPHKLAEFSNYNILGRSKSSKQEDKPM